MARFILTVDYENDTEWNVGTNPRYEKGERATGAEVAAALRKVADQVEEWDKTAEKPFGVPVKYPNHGVEVA